MIRENQWKFLDNFKRKLFLKTELKKLLLKSLLNNTKLPLSYRYLIFYNKIKLSRLKSINQQKNRCVQTGRNWSIVKSTRYSRFVFRKETYEGNLPGFKRASW